MRDSGREILVVQRGGTGVAAGICGCIFAVLGVFSLGIVFVPIAAVCSVTGFMRAATGRSVAGLAMAALSTVLTCVGFLTSPALLFVTWLSLGSSYKEDKPPETAAIPAPLVDPKITDAMKCPVGGGEVTLSGVASERSIGDRPKVWILRTERPFCLTVHPPVAPTQRVVLSAAEIEGQAPPSGIKIELSGLLYTNRPLPSGELIPVLVVKSGRRVK